MCKEERNKHSRYGAMLRWIHMQDKKATRTNCGALHFPLHTHHQNLIHTVAVEHPNSYIQSSPYEILIPQESAQ